MVNFGLQIEPQFGFTYEQIRDLALLCETTGFNSIWCSDHLFLNADSAERDCWEAWTALTGLAVETSTVRFGTLVTSTSYRYPSMLAKTAACVDYMSGGRLEMGIGTGWKEAEYHGYGIPFPSARERVDRFEEGLNILLKMWTEPAATFKGKYYEIEKAFCSPKPVQKPHPPLWIGCKGNRMLDIASRYADWVNISGFPPLDFYNDRMERLKAACKKNNRDFDKIRKSHFTGIAVAPDENGLDELVQDIAKFRGQSPDEVRANFRGFMGTPDGVTEYLRPFVDAGVEQFMLVFPFGHEADSVRLLAEKVLPELRR
jgi:F420-dependent oxidoreductase-like protein